MKTLSFLLVLAALSSSAMAEELTLVQSRVIKVELLPPPPDTRDEQDLREGLEAPVGGKHWGAWMKVERVFSGDASFVGQIMTQLTMHESPIGNSRPIVPLLRVGDEGLFPIKRFESGRLGSPAFGLPALPEGQLPLIKGRDAGYDKALQRLLAEAGETSAAPATSVGSDRSPSAQSEGGASQSAMPAEVTKPAPSAFPAWVVGVVVVGVLVAGFLVVRVMTRAK